jgi:hypothetical protein
MYLETNYIKKIQKLTFQKIKDRLWNFFVLSIISKTWFYFYFYKSYWHSILNSKIKINKINYKSYISTKVNPGAGIGHQLANYNSSIWYAKKFNLIHAHEVFPNKKWEKILGFNSSVICSKDILNKQYKKIELPIFKENNLTELSKIKKIIQSYRNQKVIFFLEQDQPYTKQYEISDYIKEKFFSSKQRKRDKIMYKHKDINIAVHIRLPMIIEDVVKRYNDANYAVNIINHSFNMLKNFLKKIITKKKIKIFIFTQFYDEKLKIFNKFKNVEYCYKISPYESFINLIHADVLLTSKSSFSYKAGLINKGIKISPKNFWHGYPWNDKNWILADTSGKLLNSSKKIILK